MRVLLCLLSALVAPGDAQAAGDRFTPTGQSLHINDGDFATRDHARREPLQPRQRALHASPGSCGLHCITGGAVNWSETSPEFSLETS